MFCFTWEEMSALVILNALSICLGNEKLAAKVLQTAHVWLDNDHHSERAIDGLSSVNLHRLAMMPIDGPLFTSIF